MARPSASTLTQAVAGSPQTDRLVTALRGYAVAQLEQLAVSAARRLGETTARLDDIAEGRGPGLGELLAPAGALAGGKPDVRGALSSGAGRVKQAVLDRIGQLGGEKGGKKGGRSGRRPTVIVEYVDVGVPVREAYDQWTRLEEFGDFTKGVRSVSVADEETSHWRAKVFWSDRSWEARITEQIEDERIAWTSEGAKGTTDGVVTFHELAPALTRIVLVVEYHPQGLFEKTGNLWRAQGRRVRLDLKHFARHVTMQPAAAAAEEDEEEVGDDYEEEPVEEEEAEYERAGR